MLKKIKVLIADDNPADYHLLGSYLEANGIEILFPSSEEETILKKIETHSPTVILLETCLGKSTQTPNDIWLKIRERFHTPIILISHSGGHTNDTLDSDYLKNYVYDKKDKDYFSFLLGAIRKAQHDIIHTEKTLKQKKLHVLKLLLDKTGRPILHKHANSDYRDINIPISSITYLEAGNKLIHNSSIVWVLLKEDDIPYCYLEIHSLCEMKDLLSSEDMMRLHNSFIINRTHIIEFKEHQHININGKELPIGGDHYAEKIEMLICYLNSLN